MPEQDRDNEQALREAAYRRWEREGRPEGRALDHWLHVIREEARKERARDDEPMEDEEKILAGRTDVNLPALLTRDVPGG